jgi:hypothetical protein
MKDNEDTNIIDKLDDGHWGQDTTQYLAREIKKIL